MKFICSLIVVEDVGKGLNTQRFGCPRKAFELAFPCDSVSNLDSSNEALVGRGALPVHAPLDMPWGMRTALFADIDGDTRDNFVRLENA